MRKHKVLRECWCACSSLLQIILLLTTTLIACTLQRSLVARSAQQRGLGFESWAGRSWFGVLLSLVFIYLRLGVRPKSRSRDLAIQQERKANNSVLLSVCVWRLCVRGLLILVCARGVEHACVPLPSSIRPSAHMLCQPFIKQLIVGLLSKYPVNQTLLST